MPSAPPTPAGPYTVPLHKLAQMIAECAAFQERCGLTYPDALAEDKLVNGEGGLKRIYYPAIEEATWQEKLPLAVIQQGEEWGLTPVAWGARNFFHGPRGALELILADEDLQPHSVEASERHFMNWVGQMLQGTEPLPGLGILAASNDRLSISEITQLDRPAWCPRDEQNSRGRAYWTARFSIRYGFD